LYEQKCVHTHAGVEGGVKFQSTRYSLVLINLVPDNLSS